MDFLITLVKVIHIISCLLLTVVVLLQSGKGGGMGAIGGGSSTTVFGGGGDSVLVRTAAIFSGIFILTSVSLAWFATRGYEQRLATKAARVRANQELKNLKKYETRTKPSWRSFTRKPKATRPLPSLC
jgi:protein translocase SecG subunit